MFDIYFRTIRAKEFKTLESVRDGVWINIENATKRDLERVVELTGLDYIDLDDSLDLYELPRIERQEDSVIIFVRNPKLKKSEKDYLDTQVLTIVISDKYFITISKSKNKVIEDLLNNKNSFDTATTQRGKLLSHVLLNISKGFTNEIRKVKNNVISQKRHIKNIDNTDIVKLIENEEILNQYLSALVPMRVVFKEITSGKYIQLYEYDKDLFEDMTISIQQSVDLCDTSIKSIQSLRDSYQIIFTNRLNKTMKFLASFTIIMTVPTIIASIYGMNVRLPLAGHPVAFWYVMIISIGISALFLFIFRKNRWF